MLPLPMRVTSVLGHVVPNGARPLGYAALAAAYGLDAPAPDRLFAAGERHTLRTEGRWSVLTPRYQPPADTLVSHLGFALRHEAIDLGLLAALFRRPEARRAITAWVRRQPTGRHPRRAWFLYEWLTGEQLDLPPAPRVTAADVLDPAHQFAISGEVVPRYRVRNNLPGTPAFCPLVRLSPDLVTMRASDLAEEARAVVRRTAPDLMARAAAFLLLLDSKASYVIEGERPPQDRIQRWGQALGEAGRTVLDTDELLRLQRLVIGRDTRFLRLGWRSLGGFIGARDRDSNAPLPDHVSARPEDLAVLIDGLLAFAARSEAGVLDPIVSAACLAFGFVFIHPFEDGNGRIHRWLLHHVLARRGFNPPGISFPVSAVFLARIEAYRAVLEHFSRPRLALTEWETTPDFNVRVLNETRDLFRFFDATRQAEFLASSVVETVRTILPREVEYLRRYDLSKVRIQNFLEMPDSRFDLMIGFLRQNGGRFSRRARTNEFAALTDVEVLAIEGIYADLLLDHG
ncbi:Fic family protein [Rhodovastum atsumiense]|uniref:Fic family protein n=1 Tax=Rhodovastum atsumiense TaxID=504468 RepID=A0A5M6IK94_9PROT|nr:Fic family protein [Rhodovastum atsumiense]KAA5608674.1 Fic family protein [Rhodovastum atsumiense]